MNKYLLSLIAILLVFSLNAEVVGIISFFTGSVKYKKDPNSTFMSAELNMPVHTEGVIKTDLAGEAEIRFHDGTIAKIEANKTMFINDILEDASQQGSWKDKILRQMKNLKILHKKEASSVAGIRRTEAKLKELDDFYWVLEEPASFEEAEELYEEGQYSKAIPILEKVIEQNPMHSNAEFSHVLLILIYDKQNNIEARDAHIRLLKNDFPHSSFLNDLPDI
ncbi:MAG: hypothetical protein PWP64_544 [Candidatus Cloacimonadota bacterium]|nr:hypothetical protein [Candidatus Cloacimonadota bacterium]